MKYYIVKDKMRQGPYDLHELARQALTPSTLVWTAGMPDWVEAREVPELSHLLTTPAAVPETSHTAPIGEPFPPEVPVEPLPQEPVVASPTPTFEPPMPTQVASAPRKWHGWLWIVGVLVVLALLLVTRPSRKAHVDAIASACRAYTSEKIDSSWLSITTVTAEGGKWVMNRLVDDFIERHLSTDDYFLLNVGHMEVLGESKMVSLGILGHVFTFDKQDVARVVDKYLEEQRPSPAQEAQQAIEEVYDNARDVATQVLDEAGIDSTAIGRDLDSLASHATQALKVKGQEVLNSAINDIVDEIDRQLGSDDH